MRRKYFNGEWNSPEYSSWRAMKRRCYNQNFKQYFDYGGRGICVRDRWLDCEDGFKNFLEDMGHKPGPEYTLERMDNDLDYTPDNCEWATRQEQIVITHKSN